MKIFTHIQEQSRKLLVQQMRILYWIGATMFVSSFGFAADLPYATIAVINLPDQAIVNQPITIEVRVTNDGSDAKTGSISISLPRQSKNRHPKS